MASVAYSLRLRWGVKDENRRKTSNDMQFELSFKKSVSYFKVNNTQILWKETNQQNTSIEI
jgi:hypothetical protein